MKKIIKIIMIFLIIIFAVINVCSHNEKNNVEMIESISYCDYLSELGPIYYTLEEDIKKAEKKIRMINFYPSCNKLPLQQSPTMSITINYKNGAKKEILMVEGRALIATTTLEGNVSGKFYYINPFAMRWNMQCN